APASESPAGFGPFTAPLHADHPLVGTAYATVDGTTLSPAELEAHVAAATYLLLGETHDHPDHHRLQGLMLETFIAAGPPPAVAYEMLDPSDQAEIDAFLAQTERDVDAFGALVDWANSGWPEWSLYRPAFEAPVRAGVPILAAQVPRTETKRYMSEGLGILAPEVVSRYALDQPLPTPLADKLLDEMFASHCEMVPREQLLPMVEIQRIRDARMAEALRSGAAAHGRAALVAGTGHTRTHGVPNLLAGLLDEGETMLSIGFTSVDPELQDAAHYGGEHDILVFTPEVEREDPCAAMRKQTN
ncbi:MAG: ChaN family lipoprotein, partial [Myxococcales bacterium]|nr:ChaN family lipoprotein [Myxococcales bacterium]